MKKMFTMLLIMSYFSLFSASAPIAEPVYGGYIENYDAIALDATTTRLFIQTNSANSMFYADVDYSTPSNPIFGTFSTIPDLDYNDGIGQNIRCFSADENSGYIFVGTSSDGFLACNTSASSTISIDSAIIEDVEIIDSYIFWIQFAGSDVNLHFGQIYPSGHANVGEIYNEDFCVITSSGYGGSYNPKIIINPNDNKLYLFEDGTPPIIYQSSDTYSNIDAATTFSTLTTTDLATTGYHYFAAGIGPDGRIFAAGYIQLPSQTSYLGYSDDFGANWTTLTTGVDTGWGNQVTIANTSPNYHVYFGRGVSNNNGVSGSWAGMSSSGTPVMDSPHCVDPLDSEIVYLRTDWGLGYYDSDAGTASEWNDGITAVQVDDFDMDETKEIAWVASKSGVWYVEDYSTSPTWITTPLWPGNDSTPYRSICATTTGDTVYAGSQSAVWKYESSYGSLISSNFVQAINLNSLGLTPGIYASSIAFDDYSSSERIYVGVYDWEDHDETTEDRGGIYQVDYNGSIWSYTAITGGELPAYGVDPNDIVVVEESGNTVLYVGVDYHQYMSYDTANAVYRCEDTGAGWDITFDFIEAGTLIEMNASIKDLYVTNSDIIYACGTDEFDSSVRCYYKAVGDTYWTVVSNTGLPSGIAHAITFDEVNQDLYIAVNSTIYVRYYGASSWVTFYEYPSGTNISFIYYDDLLVGTDYGLYGHEAEDAPLPVTLSSFTATFDGYNSVLQWITQSELNNQGWNIYRSPSDNFSLSSKINPILITGAGTTNQVTEYFYTDEIEFQFDDTYFYWLESMDYANVTVLYNPISVEISQEPDNPSAPSIPIRPGLQQNYPNPFNPSTQIRFAVEEEGLAQISIYNTKGQKITSIFNNEVKANEYYNVEWSGKDQEGKDVASGIYLYYLKTANKSYFKKMLLIK